MRVMISATVVLIALTVLRCSAADGVSSSTMSEQQQKQEAWHVEITTDGGFTGKGLGSVTLDSSGHVDAADITHHCEGALTPTESSTLATAAAAAAPGSWRPSYETPGAPHGHPDEIHYSLSFIRGAKSYTTSWYGEAGSALPQDLVTLRDASWNVRSRVVATCK